MGERKQPTVTEINAVNVNEKWAIHFYGSFVASVSLSDEANWYANLSIQDVINSEFAVEMVSMELSSLSWFSGAGGVLHVHPYAAYASISDNWNRWKWKPISMAVWWSWRFRASYRWRFPFVRFHMKPITTSAEPMSISRSITHHTNIPIWSHKKWADSRTVTDNCINRIRERRWGQRSIKLTRKLPLWRQPSDDSIGSQKSVPFFLIISFLFFYLFCRFQQFLTSSWPTS